MSESITAVVDTFYAAFSGDPRLLAQAVSPEWEDLPRHPGQVPGPEGARPIIEGLVAMFSDLEIVVHQIVDGRGSDGNGTIAVRAEMRGTHTGEAFGIPGSGRTVSIPLHEFHQVDGGRLTRTWHLEDWLGFFVQVGGSPRIGGDPR